MLTLKISLFITLQVYFILSKLANFADFYYRPIIHYRDLDAPKEPEENFI